MLAAAGGNMKAESDARMTAADCDDGEHCNGVRACFVRNESTNETAATRGGPGQLTSLMGAEAARDMWYCRRASRGSGTGELSGAGEEQ
jgi:hypothetical protein